MDYEQKYKDALNLARSYYSEDTNTFLDTLFPELRESEEERIRTRLSEYFRGFLEGNEHCYENGGYVKWEGLDVKSILDWLEKQKEQEHICDSTQYEEGFKTGLEIGLRKQKEQKPAEVDESTKRLNDNWMKQHFDDYQERKPAEWSEEDVDMLNSCISSIEEAKENRYAYKETDGDTSYDHEIAWLKSLRPSWKPSEEQMIELRAVISGCSFDTKTLSSLEKDLKKLM